ncbi:hypothetical protein [Mucilaginibacter sp.]
MKHEVKKKGNLLGQMLVNINRVNILHEPMQLNDVKHDMDKNKALKQFAIIITIIIIVLIVALKLFLQDFYKMG